MNPRDPRGRKTRLIPKFAGFRFLKIRRVIVDNGFRESCTTCFVPLSTSSLKTLLQVRRCTVSGKGILCNIGGKLLAAEQRDGGRTICAVFGDNHIITLALWNHACEDIIGRVGC